MHQIGVRHDCRAHRRPMETPRSRQTRRAFSLIEILVVLAILAVVVSIGWPSVLRYMGENVIREQAHTVRLEMTSARIKAIDTGLVYQFRYEPGGRRFVVIPHDRPDVGAGESAAMVGGGGITASGALQRVPVTSGQLPEACRFEPPTTTNPLTNADQMAYTEQIAQEWLTLLPDGVLLQQTRWAPAIRFFPDGSTDSATVVILDENRRRIELTIRGFTGEVTASPLVQETR